MSELELAYDVSGKSVILTDFAQRIASQGYVRQVLDSSAWLPFKELTATDQRLATRLTIHDLGQGANIKPFAVRAGVTKSDEDHLADLAGTIKEWLEAEGPKSDQIALAEYVSMGDELAEYILHHWPKP